MVMNTVATATPTVGGDTIVSFGSGNEGNSGLNRRSRGRGAQQNARPGEISALRRRINASGLSARRKRQIIEEIDLNRKSNGNITRGALRDVAEAFADLMG